MPRACDACQTRPAVFHCRADVAFLCSDCDRKVHGANKLAQRHERVPLCDVCEVLPAVVNCKADAAALCVTCDSDIHSANPLARRHERTPVVPLFECPSQSLRVAHINELVVNSENCRVDVDMEAEDRSVVEEANSWLLQHPKPLMETNCMNDGKPSLGGRDLECLNNDEDEDGALGTSFLVTGVGVGGYSPNSPLGNKEDALISKLKASSKLEVSSGDYSEVDPYLDFDYATKFGSNHTLVGADSLVPVHNSENHNGASPSLSTESGSFDEDGVRKGTYGYGNSPLSHSMSSSSLEVGIVPDASLSDISTPIDTYSQGNFEHPRALQVGPVDTSPMAREAKVMRYKEKRKTRKFEKRIRYQSRKAYAESRPRIKGRFAKRDDASSLDQMRPEGGFGIVPSVPSF